MIRRIERRSWTLVDLLSCLLGPPESRDGSSDPWWLCPFHGDENPSLHVMPDGRRWKCFGCDAAGDAIDIVRGLEPSLTYRQAKKLIETQPPDKIAAKVGSQTCSTCSTRSLSSAGKGLSKSVKKQTPQWHSTAKEILAVAERGMKSRLAADAKEFLSQRGISSTTARKARLGYVDSDFVASELRVPGDAIAIPWFSRRQLVAINFRRLSGERRYQLLSGSTKGVVYPGTEMDPTRPVVLCEGEFDCLLANQMAGDVAQFATLGSASDKLSPPSLSMLAACFSLFLALDADEAGDRAADRLTGLLPRAVRLRPPVKAKDFGGIYASGRDLRTWIMSAIERATRTTRRK